ncbi:hypothetical protein [Novosphingobium gossypii]|uniref:hypothetical protein n=1 Tax=Novosphingobium gossypii TaxID=1604774 RepID=UPI003D1B3E66
MKTIYSLALPCAALIAHPVVAQTKTAPVATLQGQAGVAMPIAAVVPSAQPDILRAGLSVALIMREELTTKKKKLRVGQRFQMEVAENITQNGVVVIPSGTPAVGEVTEVRNKGMWGKSGYIGARVVSLNLNGRNVRLSGTFDDKGVTGTGGVVAAIAFVPIAGFLTTGTSAFIASGSPVKGFLDEDLAFQAVQPQVIQVPAAVPAAAPAATAQGVLTSASLTK